MKEMKEFKGTKGKWEINPIASRNVRCNGKTIANCSSGQNGDDEDVEKANAKLIATAPEMFEMLKKLIITFKGDGLENYQEIRIEEAEQLLTKITE